MSGTEAPSPFLEFDRASWARLREHEPMALTQADVDRISGLGEDMDLKEVEEVYLPLSRLLTHYVNATANLHSVTSEFLGERPVRTPFVIGVAGSVAVGKSTTSRVLREVMRHWEATPDVTLVTTDGFLYPNEVLEEKGLLNRKGFPESYDRRALVRFVAEVKAGKPVVTAPVYSHKTYDIVPGERIEVRRPDVLIIEGLNILQPPQRSFDGRRGLTVSDFVDFSVYVDARLEDIKHWYLSRFLQLRDTAFADPNAYFHRYANLTDETAVAIAETVWGAINEPNLKENVLPTRSRATCVLTKGADHAVRRVRLRKI